MSELHPDPNEGDQNEEPTVEELQQQLADKEQDINYLKGKWGEEKSGLMSDLKSLNDRQSEVEGRVKEQRDLLDRSNQEPAVDPFELTEEALDDIRDDPTKIVSMLRDTQNRTVSVVLDALKQRDANLDQRLDKLGGSVESRFKELNPETLQWRKAIDELKEKNEAFSKLDDDTLIAIARDKEMTPSMEYRGSAGGQRQRESTETKAKAFDPNSDDGAVQIALYMAKGDLKHAEKLWNDAETKAGRV
jgi:hypothetical protein